MVLDDCGFFGQHHRDFVANRINPPARNAFQTGFIRQQLDARLAYGANQNVESVFGNRHDSSWLANEYSKEALYQTPSMLSNSPHQK